MEILPDDEKVVELLSKLKNSNGDYPSDMFASRRRTYLKQVANVGLGIGIGAGFKNAAKGGNGAGATATITSKILEVALVTAIAIEAGTAAYLYRDKIADVVKTYTNPANIQVAVPTTDDIASTNPALVEIIESPSASATPGTPSMTPSGTQSPEVAVNNNGNNGTGTNVSSNSTPDPGGNNGNHFGQTPKPERTKDNKKDGGGNNSGGGNSTGNGNKP